MTLCAHRHGPAYISAHTRRHSGDLQSERKGRERGVGERGIDIWINEFTEDGMGGSSAMV